MSTHDDRRSESAQSENSLPISDIAQKNVDAVEAEKVKGGIEITDYGFGVSMPVTGGSSPTVKSK